MCHLLPALFPASAPVVVSIVLRDTGQAEGAPARMLSGCFTLAAKYTAARPSIHEQPNLPFQPAQLAASASLAALKRPALRLPSGADGSVIFHFLIESRPLWLLSVCLEFEFDFDFELDFEIDRCNSARSEALFQALGELAWRRPGDHVAAWRSRQLSALAFVGAEVCNFKSDVCRRAGDSCNNYFRPKQRHPRIGARFEANQSCQIH